MREGLSLSDSDDGGLDMVALAKQQRGAAASAPQPAARASPRPPARSPSAAASPTGIPRPPPRSPGVPTVRAADTDESDEGFDIVAAAKKSSSSQQGRARAAASPPPAPAAQKPAPAPTAAAPAEPSSDSDSEDLLTAAAKQRSTKRASLAAAQPSPTRVSSATAAAPAPTSSPSAHSPLKPTTSIRAVQPAAPGAASLQAKGPQRGQQAATAAPFALRHQPPAKPAVTLEELAAGELSMLEEGSRGGSPVTSPAPRTSGAGKAVACAPVAAAAAAAAAPASPGVPLASLAELQGVVSGAVGELACTLRSDLGRMEAGWQERWAEQAAGACDLRARLEGLASAGATQAAEVSGRLEGMAAELAQQRARLEAVERAQQAAPAAASQAVPAQEARQGLPAVPAPALSPALAPAEGSAPSVEDILRRLSMLESRVGAQLQSIEAACPPGATGGPHSAPVSPLKGRDARAAAAAALAAAAVYGSGTATQSECCDASQAKLPAGCPAWAWEAAVPGSPRIAASGLARPASAAGGYFGGGSGASAGVLRHSPGGSAGKQRSKEVELQVAQTSALIAGIQGQIAAIKDSLVHAAGEMDARRAEAACASQRLDSLERTDRHMVKVEAANLAGACALERRVRSLEEAVAAAARSAAAGGAVARETQKALAALEWRVDKSADATIGTIKALEARQDRQRSQLDGVAATAALADAKCTALQAEVARLQRRVHGGGSPLGGAGSPGRSPFRLY